jgi:hypothetical protein
LVKMRDDMTASQELAILFKKISQEVDGWETWKRSIDPLGSERLQPTKKTSKTDENWAFNGPKAGS